MDNPVTSGNQGQKILDHWEINEVVGRIMSLVEMCGLTDKQEKATKEAIKRELWSLWKHEPDWSPVFYDYKREVRDMVLKIYREGQASCTNGLEQSPTTGTN